MSKSKPKPQSDGVTEQLLRAAADGDTAQVKVCLTAGAHLNSVNYNGQTALIRAAFFGHREVVRVLLAAGADTQVKDMVGLSALDWSIARGFPEIAQVLRSVTSAPAKPAAEYRPSTIATPRVGQEKTTRSGENARVTELPSAPAQTRSVDQSPTDVGPEVAPARAPHSTRGVSTDAVTESQQVAQTRTVASRGNAEKKSAVRSKNLQTGEPPTQPGTSLQSAPNIDDTQRPVSATVVKSDRAEPAVQPRVDARTPPIPTKPITPPGSADIVPQAEKRGRVSQTSEDKTPSELSGPASPPATRKIAREPQPAPVIDATAREKAAPVFGQSGVSQQSSESYAEPRPNEPAAGIATAQQSPTSGAGTSSSPRPDKAEVDTAKPAADRKASGPSTSQDARSQLRSSAPPAQEFLKQREVRDQTTATQTDASTPQVSGESSPGEKLSARFSQPTALGAGDVSASSRTSTQDLRQPVPFRTKATPREGTGFVWLMLAVAALVGISISYLLINRRSPEPVPATAPVAPPTKPVEAQPVNNSPVVDGAIKNSELSVPDAEYPAAAKSQRLSASITVAVVVSDKGKVVSVRASQGPQLLRKAAAAAARKAVFKPQPELRRSGTITYSFAPTEAPATTASQPAHGARDAEPQQPPSQPEQSPTVEGAIKGDEVSVPDAQYPAEAKRRGISGPITVTVKVSSEGRVFATRASKGPAALRKAAVVAARKATFKPQKGARRSGRIIYLFSPERH